MAPIHPRKHGVSDYLGAIDRAGTAAGNAVMTSLEVGGSRMIDVSCRVAALHPFRSLRDDQGIGLFGNEQFAAFDRVVIDFSRRSVEFHGPRR